jgi:hypothetical protein
VSELVGAQLAALRDLSSSDLTAKFAQPGAAIQLIADDLKALWDSHRSADPNERRIGILELDDGAYIQWIGYSNRLVVEVSSNTYLPDTVKLRPGQERLIRTAGFSPSNGAEPNFWMQVHDPADIARAAFAVVAVLTAAFGVYAP